MATAASHWLGVDRCQRLPNCHVPQNLWRNSAAHMRARVLTDNFKSLISLSISSIKLIIKSTSLCLYICSMWKLVIRKLMSYPCNINRSCLLSTHSQIGQLQAESAEPVSIILIHERIRCWWLGKKSSIQGISVYTYENWRWQSLGRN